MATASLLLSFLLAANPREQKLDALVEQARKAWDVPGISLVVISKDDILHLKGYGVRELGKPEPVTPDTVFPLASCTKAFTTTLAAMLADEGKLNWDDSVRKYLPDFHLSDPGADSLVSLRDLAAHRTGVASHDLLWYRSPFTQSELVRRVSKLPLSKIFRQDMQYQSIMYLALGQAVARAQNTTWEELVAERIFKPLGMKRGSLTTLEAAKSPDRSGGHRTNKQGKLEVVPWYEQKVPNPAGSINASARDLAPWLQLHLNGGTHRGVRLVSEANLSETHQPQTIIPLRGEARKIQPDTLQLNYGLAWVVSDYRGEAIVQHSGLIDGFRAHLTILPKRGYAFAILANREATRMNLALSNSVVDLLLDLPVKDWNAYLIDVVEQDALANQIQARREDLARKPNILPSLPLKALSGRYSDEAYGPSTIRLAADGLVWEWGSWKLPLEHYAGDSFRLQSDNPLLNRAFLKFEVVDGKPARYRLLGLTFDRMAK